MMGRWDTQDGSDWTASKHEKQRSVDIPMPSSWPHHHLGFYSSQKRPADSLSHLASTLNFELLRYCFQHLLSDDSSWTFQQHIWPKIEQRHASRPVRSGTNSLQIDLRVVDWQIITANKLPQVAIYYPLLSFGWSIHFSYILLTSDFYYPPIISPKTTFLSHISSSERSLTSSNSSERKRR